MSVGTMQQVSHLVVEGRKKLLMFWMKMRNLHSMKRANLVELQLIPVGATNTRRKRDVGVVGGIRNVVQRATSWSSGAKISIGVRSWPDSR